MRNDRLHISSAVVFTWPEKTDAVAQEVAVLDGVEIHAKAAGKIVIVLEGANSGALGDILIRISAMDHVIAANMVFEQLLDEQEDTDDSRTHAA
jgi:nitrate reductase NapD